MYRMQLRLLKSNVFNKIERNGINAHLKCVIIDGQNLLLTDSGDKLDKF